MELNYYQIDNITIEEAATNAIIRVAETYSPSLLIHCANLAGLYLPYIPGEKKYFVEHDYDTANKLPLMYHVAKNNWTRHVDKHIRQPFKKYFLYLINNSTQDVIEQWGIKCYNMMRNVDNQYD